MSGFAKVITVSDRAFAGTRDDRSGPLGAELLTGAGWSTDVVVVPVAEEVEDFAVVRQHFV